MTAYLTEKESERKEGKEGLCRSWNEAGWLLRERDTGIEGFLTFTVRCPHSDPDLLMSSVWTHSVVPVTQTD